jgi:hypothetical protein
VVDESGVASAQWVVRSMMVWMCVALGGRELANYVHMDMGKSARRNRNGSGGGVDGCECGFLLVGNGHIVWSSD